MGNIKTLDYFKGGIASSFKHYDITEELTILKHYLEKISEKFFNSIDILNSFSREIYEKREELGFHDPDLGARIS